MRYYKTRMPESELRSRIVEHCQRCGVRYIGADMLDYMVRAAKDNFSHAIDFEKPAMVSFTVFVTKDD